MHGGSSCSFGTQHGWVLGASEKRVQCAGRLCVERLVNRQHRSSALHALGMSFREIHTLSPGPCSMSLPILASGRGVHAGELSMPHHLCWSNQDVAGLPTCVQVFGGLVTGMVVKYCDVSLKRRAVNKCWSTKCCSSYPHALCCAPALGPQCCLACRQPLCLWKSQCPWTAWTAAQPPTYIHASSAFSLSLNALSLCTCCRTFSKILRWPFP